MNTEIVQKYKKYQKKLRNESNPVKQGKYLKKVNFYKKQMGGGILDDIKGAVERLTKSSEDLSETETKSHEALTTIINNIKNDLAKLAESTKNTEILSKVELVKQNLTNIQEEKSAPIPEASVPTTMSEVVAPPTDVAPVSQSAPQMPQMPPMHSISSMPPMAQMSQMPPMQQMPQMPPMPPMQQMQQMPPMQQMQQMPPMTGGVLQSGGSSDVENIFRLSNIPGMGSAMFSGGFQKKFGNKFF
jgi:hypothetical protein